MGDNTGHSPVGPLRQLKIIRFRESRKAAWCSAGGAWPWLPAPAGRPVSPETKALNLGSSLFCSVDLNLTTYTTFVRRNRSR